MVSKNETNCNTDENLRYNKEHVIVCIIVMVNTPHPHLNPPPSPALCAGIFDKREETVGERNVAL